MTNITKRKQEHITLALDTNSQTGKSLFADYLLPYRTLPEINLADVDTSTTLLGKKISQPLIISSMTGGVKFAQTINANLAIAVEKIHGAMGVGSQRIGLEIDEAKQSFITVRKLAPTAVIFANMGAQQLNYGYKLTDYQRVVDMIQADGLYLHLNPLQEAIQPEGDTNFSNLLSKIEGLVQTISVPIFIKEVGHGLDPITAKKLVDIGVTGIDSAGVGGTSWAWIESQRAHNDDLGRWFKDYGYPTDWLIPKLAESKGKASLVASGGIRSPLQGLKAHLLGADYFAAAQPFLKPALESPEHIFTALVTWQKGLKIALFSIGCQSWQEAKKLKLLKI